jgi:hypothetical protein
LIEQGSHAELLALDGTYARLVRIQTSVSKNPDVDKLIYNAAESEKNKRAAAVSNSERSGVSVLDRPESKSRKSDTQIVDEAKKVDDSDTGTSDTGDADTDEVGDEVGDKVGDEVGDKVGDEVGDAQNTSAPAIVWFEDSQCELRRGTHDRIELWVDGKLNAASVFIVKTFPSKYPAGYLSVRSWKDNGEEYECGMIRDLGEWRSSNRMLVEEMIERRYLMRRILRVRKNQLESGYLNMEVETDRGPCKLTMRWTQSQALEYSENGKLLIDTCENRYVVENVDALPAEDRERFLQFIYW